MPLKRSVFRRSLMLALTAGWLIAAVSGRAAVLYDGASNATPNQVPWLWGYQALNKTNPFTPHQVTQSAAGGVTTLDSTAVIHDVAGYTTHIPNLLSPGFSYTHPNLQVLDRTAGFIVRFTVRVNSETHSSNDRSGFSVIALSNDPTPRGIELAFWTNEIWAQNAGFTHGESSGAFDTTGGLIDYQLLVLGSTYQLSANNSPILTGSLRDYTAFSGGPPFNSGFPYNQQNFLFFGDNTSSARASIALAQIAVDEIQSVPEPAAWALAWIGFVGLVLYYRSPT